MNDTKIIGTSSFSFSGINWGKVGAGILVSVATAILTFLTSFIAGIDWSQVHLIIAHIDFGQFLQPIVISGWGTISVIVRKWVSHNE